MRLKHDKRKGTSLNPNVASLLFSQQHESIGGQDAHSYENKQQTSNVATAASLRYFSDPTGGVNAKRGK